MLTFKKIFPVLFLLLTPMAIVFSQERHNDQIEKPGTEGLYLGQTPPGDRPEIFAPGIISTDMFEFGLTMSSDRTELYFTRRPDYNGAENRIYVLRVTGGRLTKPVLADFAKDCFEFLPSISPDGRVLYFYSDRPKPQTSKYDGNLWFCKKTENGWSSAEYLDNPANSKSSMTVSSTEKGVLYYSAISGKRLCVFKFSGEQSAVPEKLPDYINKFNPTHPFISPDESYLLFDSQINGMGKPELFICYRQNDGSWTEPVNMGSEINKTKNEFAASVSPDGKYLFFHRRTDGNGDIYWVSADIIGKLSPKK